MIRLLVDAGAVCDVNAQVNPENCFYNIILLCSLYRDVASFWDVTFLFAFFLDTM